jgi:hypothetical protein
MGAAYGTAKSGIGIAGVGTFRPDLIMKVSRDVEATGTRHNILTRLLTPFNSPLFPSSCLVLSQSTRS